MHACHCCNCGADITYVIMCDPDDGEEDSNG